MFGYATSLRSLSQGRANFSMEFSRYAEVPSSGDPLELRPGVRVGRYVIGERLGAGGMGVVHAAVDSELQRRVALKVLRPEHDVQLSSVGRERLLREARTLARLSHPNVVTVFDVGTHHGHLFLAMELVDGGSLTAWLREPRSTEDIIERMIEAGRGLAAAHTAGVVHRDVKPDNILVGLDGRARMTDFGLAHIEDTTPLVDDPVSSNSSGLLDPLTRTGTLMGTPIYMAPEHLLQGATTPLTDQWSFCATLYEALAGVRPFVVDDLAARMSAIDAGRLIAPQPGRRVPAWVRQILLRGLRSDPSARWPSMDAIVDAVRRRHRRKKYLALAFAGVLAISGGAFAVQLAGADPAPTKDLPNAMQSPQRWTDQRPGCNCPYSACSNGCLSVCNASAYELGARPSGINTPKNQDLLLGAAIDGDAILYLTGPGCSIDRLMLARRDGEAFVPVDLTDQLDRSRTALFEGCCTLSADGQTLILGKPGRAGFVQARLDGDRVLPVEADLVVVDPRASPGTVMRQPVLSSDGLTLYYRLDAPGEDATELGPLTGSYYAERADLKSPFGTPQRMKGRTRQYEYISGVSSDGLSLFMMSDFETLVLVRASITEPFGDPAPWLVPGRLGGWRAIPLENCRRILTTYSEGGCRNEDIAYLEAVR
jgi:serine/threonine protein kinase